MNRRQKERYQLAIEKKAIEEIEKILGSSAIGRDILLKDEFVMDMIKRVFYEGMQYGMSETQRIYGGESFHTRARSGETNDSNNI